MFKTPAELKKFIKWAKSEKISQMQVGEVQIVFSPLAFIEETANEFEPPKPRKTEEKNTQRTLIDDAKSEDDEDLLYYSAT